MVIAEGKEGRRISVKRRDEVERERERERESDVPGKGIKSRDVGSGE